MLPACWAHYHHADFHTDDLYSGDSVYMLGAIAFIQCIVDELNFTHATTLYLLSVGQVISL